MKFVKNLALVTIFLLSSFICKAGSEIVQPKDSQAYYNYNPILAKWNGIFGATSYKIQVATDSLFTSPVISATSPINSYSIVLGVKGRYFMRIKSNLDKDWTPFISFWIIDIGAISGKVAWQSADTLITQASNVVDAWGDMINVSRVASQTSAANKPTYKTNISVLNNKPVLSFSGSPSTPSYLDFNIGLASPLYSLYMLRNFKPNNTNPQYFMGSFVLGGLYAEQSHAGQGPGIFLVDGNIYSIASPVTLDTSYSVFVSTYKALYRNNILISPHANFDVPNIDVGRIGTRGDAVSLAYKGEIAEYILFNNLLDSAKNKDVHLYFRSKYAPPVNLGPDIVFGTSFTDSITLSAQGYVTYSWSNGSTAPSTKVITSGTYTVSVKDVFGNISKDDIIVYPYKRLNSATAYLCFGDSLILNLGISSPYTFLWSTGSTANSITVKNSGTYTVRITDFKGTSIFDTLYVVVDQPRIDPVIPPSNTISLCQNEKLYVISQTPLDSIRWSTGSTANNISITTAGVYSIYARTQVGCILNQSFTVNISGIAPSADFSTAPVCQNKTTVFTDVSIVPVGNTLTNWKWTFGDGNTSTSPNPSNVYLNIGSYTATLKVTTNVGCVDSIAKTVIVRKNPKADFINLLSCSGNPTTFVDQSIANSDSIQAWFWNFAGLGTSIQKNPTFDYPSASIYNTFLKVTNSYGCEDTVTKQTIVNPSPTADFKADSACLGTNTIFTNLSTVDAPYQFTNYLWEYGDGTQSIQVSQPHLYDDYGEYVVKLSVRASNQCPDVVEKTVRVFALPNVDFVISNTQCTGKSIQFTDISTSPDGVPLNNWKWFFAGQGTSTIQNPSFTFNAQGNYTIQLTAKTALGCTGSKFRSIAVTSPPVISFSFSPNYGPPPLNVTFTNGSPNNSNYIWDYGDGSPTFQGYTSPPHTYTVTGTYPIKLTATDFKGCSDSLVKYILVDNAVIDGVMVSVSIVPNGDFYKVVATILNNSNIQITSLGLTIHLANGSEVRETWTGSLQPGETLIYQFTGELRYNSNGDIPVICATIESINVSALEADVSNNTTCEEITVGQFDILTVYPNPTTDNVNFGVMLPAAGEVEITLHDMMGKVLYAIKYNGIIGYNNFLFPAVTLNAGVYIAEIKYDGSVIRKKIMRNDRGN